MVDSECCQSSDNGYQKSLAVDSNGIVHIAYYNMGCETGGDCDVLKYIKGTSGSWGLESGGVPIVVDLDAIKVQFDPEHDKDIKLDDKLTMRMRYPSLDQFIKENFQVDNVGFSESIDMIAGCVDMIFSEDETWTGADFTKKEMIDFLEQLGSKQFKLLEKFFTTMPKLSHTIKVVNPETSKESSIHLEGLASFFS